MEFNGLPNKRKNLFLGFAGSDAARKVWNVSPIGGRAFFDNYEISHRYHSFPAFLRANVSPNRRRACAASALNA